MIKVGDKIPFPFLQCQFIRTQEKNQQELT